METQYLIGTHWLADHPVTVEPFNPMAETDRQQLAPSPHIEEHPAMELKELHSQEDKLLTTYGFVAAPSHLTVTGTCAACSA